MFLSVYHCIKYYFNGFLLVADHCSNEGMVTIFYYKCNDQRMFIVVGIWLWGSVSCESGYWKFEKWKVKWKSDSLFLRSEMKIWFNLFQKWWVKWKCLEIEIEKWNFSRILEKFLDFVKHNHYKCCIWVLYIAHFLHMTCIISLFSRNEMWNDFWFYSFREVKVKLKCLEIERWKGWLTIAALKPSKSIEFSRNETLAGYWSGSCLDISCVNY